MTLDDSAQRFNIVFNQPIDFKVEEYKNPAYIKIQISKIQKNFRTKYIP